MEIVFVCTGNTCRSPLAESIAKSMSDQFQFSSAGLFAYEGGPISSNSERIILEEQLAPATLSHQFDEADSRKDLIITMTNGHKAHIKAMYPNSNVYTLKEYTGAQGDIIDPYGGDYGVYLNTYHELSHYIEKMISKLTDN